MFAIAFDLVADTAANHPKGVVNLFATIMALKAPPWLPASARDIRAFKVEHWPDLTQLVRA